MVRRYVLSVTTDSSGAATVSTKETVAGHVCAIRYVPAASNGLDTASVVTITGAESGIGIYKKTAIGTSALDLLPRAATHLASDGSAALYAAGGTAVGARVPVANEAITLVVAQGGDTKSGTFHVYVED